MSPDFDANQFIIAVIMAVAIVALIVHAHVENVRAKRSANVDRASQLKTYLEEFL